MVAGSIPRPAALGPPAPPAPIGPVAGPNAPAHAATITTTNNQPNTSTRNIVLHPPSRHEVYAPVSTDSTITERGSGNKARS